jgi:pimeloyl-ACP methyl ester carboxylesterase
VSIALSSRGIAQVVVAAIATALSACGGGGGTPSSAGATSSLKLAAVGVTTSLTAVTACAALEGKSAGGATVVSAVLVPGTPALPTHCKVNALIAPRLNMELRVPNEWNGKLHHLGGGGYNGTIPPADAAALSGGYANVSSDSGHQGTPVDATFALHDSHAAQLFGSGSVPAVTVAATELLRLAYGQTPSRTYFEGCSNGGREALMAAQRNPDLFDGIIARAPAYNWGGFQGHFNRNYKALAAVGAAFTPDKIALLAGAVRTACDAKDGIVDGVVSNPAACTFDPAILRCTGGVEAGNNCLSDAQLAAVNSWTTPASFADGAYTSPGWPLSGNEDDAAAWPLWLTGPGGNGVGSLQFLFQDTTVKNYLARDPLAVSLTYEWNSNPATLQSMALLNDATNTDLRPFVRNGGKLILWHGGNDAAVTIRATTAFYEAARQVTGVGSFDRSVRYYTAPGVDHCSGGPGADQADLLSALNAWVERGAAPGQLTASKANTDGTTAFTRPLCTYPQYPRYTGPANDPHAAKLAENYTCTTP